MIELQNLSKFYYSDSSVTVALKKVNLKLPDKGLVAITGESGSGKTTLLNVLSGQLPFDDGEMLVDGEATFGFDENDWENYRKNNIGYIFQDYSLLMDYTVIDNVMSVMVILQEEPEEARGRALKYLERVGLADLVDRRARELSSGQKQRLSIARALAKETNIIVADEPTGNLDSETGEQIIKLLAELSKDRLVLLVTHNYQQAEPYVDRKVRIHDGEIMYDQQLGENINSSSASLEKKTKRKASKKHNAEIVKYFVKKNMRARKGKACFYQLFFVLISVVAFIFLGDLLTQLDETTSKSYNDKYFLNNSDKRIVVLKEDGEEFTDEEIDKLKKVKDVISVDKYDYVQDINYYAVEGKDYNKVYNFVTHYIKRPIEGEEDTYEFIEEEIKVCEPEFIDKSHFMRSASAIDSKMFSAGEMPETLHQIVVSSDYGLEVGDKLPIYFKADNMWGVAEYYCNEFTVTGIVDCKETQIFFSNSFSRMLGAKLAGIGGTLEYDFNDLYTRFEKADSFNLVINEAIDNQAEGYPRDITIGFSQKEIVLSGIANMSTKLLDSYLIDTAIQETGGVQLLRLGEKEQYITVNDYSSQSSAHFMEISEDMFNYFYEGDSCQATLYINNYGRTDKVIKRLNKLGYKAISSYRISSDEYDEQMVYDRFTRIGVAAIILLVLVFFEVLVVAFSFRINRKDYQILRLLGLEENNIKRLLYMEQLVYSLSSIVFVAIASTVLMYLYSRGYINMNQGIHEYVSNILYYFTLPSMLFYILYSLVAQFITSKVSYFLVRGGNK